MKYKKIFLNINKNPLKLCVCGDTVQTESNRQLFEDGDVYNLVGKDIYNEFVNADVSVFNLEAPLTDKQQTIFKPGAPCISASMKSVNFFNNVPSEQTIVSCANNHIKDFGMRGIDDTINVLTNNKIPYIGISGINSENARTAIIIEKGKIKLGIYACAENEFSIASSNEGGGNGYDPLVTFDDISELKRFCDYVLVIFHAGREHYRYPSPLLQKICRKMIEKGSNAVICQHSHCVGSSEIYKNSLILYGQGNFIFDRLKRKEWDNGLMVQFVFDCDGQFSYHFVPIERGINGKIHKAEDESFEKIIHGLRDRSDQILDSQFIETAWKEFCGTQLGVYVLQGIYGIKNRYILALDRKIGNFISKKCLKNKSHRNLLKNFIRCESIRESMLTILSDSYWEKQ